MYHVILYSNYSLFIYNDQFYSLNNLGCQNVFEFPKLNKKNEN